ncbi:MAG TPA: tryptophan--tRNA ligase [archaeon]|nr:tryptophan--tRNA ligase [archaeon]
MAEISVSEVTGEVNYEEEMKRFGLEPMDAFIERMRDDRRILKQMPPMYRRGLVFAHRDFGHIYESIKTKKKFAVLTGANPSGNLHLGNKLFVDQALFFQRLGADVFIPISNDETYVFRKSDDLEKATQNAYDKVIPDLIACGFDPKKTKIFISTKTARVYELAVKVSARVTFSTAKAVFGFDNDTNIGQIFYSTVQGAHILFPQLEEYGGPKSVVVPIGIDQDPYMRLVRDVAEKIGMVKPSSTYHKFLPGLLGGKMSGSKPETCIYLNDSPEVAKKKIMRAFSGGGATLKEHKEKGGNPDVDVACQYLYYMFEDDDKKIGEIISQFKSGSMTSGDVKTYLYKKAEKYLHDYHKRREIAKKHMNKFMIS